MLSILNTQCRLKNLKLVYIVISFAYICSQFSICCLLSKILNIISFCSLHSSQYPVCGMVHIKEPLLLSRCGGSWLLLSLSEWSFTICSDIGITPGKTSLGMKVIAPSSHQFLGCFSFFPDIFSARLKVKCHLASVQMMTINFFSLWQSLLQVTCSKKFTQHSQQGDITFRSHFLFT